jgi:PAS domain S-box-containing protein
MTSQLNSRLLFFYSAISRVASGIVVAVGFLVLVGWLFDISALKSILPRLATMQANTALAFVLSGISLWLVSAKRENEWIDLIAKVCAVLTILIGLLTLCEYVFSRDLGIDQLLFQDTLTPDNAYPGRMSPVTALNFSILGFALFLLDRHQYRWPVEVFSITALLISVLVLMGYVYGIVSLYQFFPYASIAIHTTLAFSILSVGILFARPEQGLMKIFSSDNIGSIMVRRLVPAAFVLPFLLGWLLLTGQRMGLYDSTFRLVLYALSMVIAFTILIWWNASLLQSAELVRQQTQAQLSESKEREAAILYTSLDAVITIDHQGRILEFNPAAQKIFGYDRIKVLGEEMSELIIPPSLRAQHRRGLARYLATGEGPVLGKRIELTGMRADGTEFPVELAITAIAGSEQPIFTGFVRDITEHKRMEATRAQLSAIVESSDDAIIGKTLDGIITSWNESAEKVYGYVADEVVGRPISILIPPDLTNELPDILNRLRMGESINHYETVRVRKDGRRINVALTISPIRDSAGNIIGASTIARDITERKQAEEKIAYQAYLLESVNDAVIGSDENSIIRFWNQGAERMFGWKAEEVLGRSGREILRSEFINTDRETVLKMLAEQGRWKGEAIQYRRDGAQVIVEVSSITLRDANGMITGYVSVNRDIAERKWAEERLQANAARALLIAELSQGFAELTDDYQRLLGLAARHIAELIGDYCAIRLVEDDDVTLQLVVDHHLDARAQEFMHQFISSIPQRMDEGITAQVFRSGKAVLLPFVSPDAFRAQVKSEFHPLLERLNIHSVLIAPLRAEGKIIGTITMSRDQTPHPYTEDDQIFLQDLADRAALAIVSARLYAAMQQLNNQLEQRVIERTAALSQANALLQTLLDHMPDHIYFKDSQSRFIRNSRSQARALGLSDPAEAVGKSDFDFFPHAQLSYEKEQEIMRSGQPLVNVEELVVWPDGRETWVLTTKLPLLDQTGQIIGTFGISRDITDRKRAEVELQKAKLELEVANKELEAFSYSVSHDLRAPLRSIDGYSQALLEDYGELLPIEGRNFLERVRSSARRMAELIDDLLELSQVTRAHLKSVPVDLTKLAENILVELQRSHPERSVRWSVAPNLKARGDPHLLQIVLENLLNNAWKYTSKQEQAEIEFRSKYENNQTIFFVHDNGAGFNMAYASKLFGAFQRLHSTTDFPGTGIGLATVQRIIHRHGGRIWAESKVEQGAKFFFTLPTLEDIKPKIMPKVEDSILKRAKEII